MSDAPAFEVPPILITGLSGSGLTSAAKVLEDKGFYVAHNLPPAMLVELLELCAAEDSPVDRVAVVTDVRARMFHGSLAEVLVELGEKGLAPTLLYLEASDDVLINRFDSVRRTHPLQGSETLLAGISRERETLEPVRSQADIIIDTSTLSIHDLRRKIEASLGTMALGVQHIVVESFGFKHGSPRYADAMVDVRFLPNPYWEPELRAYRGVDAQVSDFVLGQPEAQKYIDAFMELIATTLEGYRREGKAFITIAVGCTGGHHRSVAVAEEIGRRLSSFENVDVNVLHRDINH